MSKYFDKPLSLMPVNYEHVGSHNLYRARQMFDLDGNQNASASFSLFWLIMVRESYRIACEAHPKSKLKRIKYLDSVYPHGVSIYRNPSRFLRWYLSRNNNVLMGDPTGNYYLPVNTHDQDFTLIPHPYPNALADRFTLSVLKYLTKMPKIRFVRKDTGYGYVEMVRPSFVYLDETGKYQRHNYDSTRYRDRSSNKTSDLKIKLTGFLTEWEIREYLIAELKVYIKYHRETMDDRYYRFLQQHPLIIGNI